MWKAAVMVMVQTSTPRPGSSGCWLFSQSLWDWAEEVCTAATASTFQHICTQHKLPRCTLKDSWDLLHLFGKKRLVEETYWHQVLPITGFQVNYISKSSDEISSAWSYTCMNFLSPNFLSVSSVNIPNQTHRLVLAPQTSVSREHATSRVSVDLVWAWVPVVWKSGRDIK